MPSHLIAPHGGSLVNLMVSEERSEEIKTLSRDWTSWTLTPRQLCDLELILNGGFSPLKTFMGREDYEGVCQNMRLADGTLWPIPITLDVSDEAANGLQPGTPLVLRDIEGVMLAVLHVEEVWQPDLSAETQQVYGTTNSEHPGVAHLTRNVQPNYVSGKLEGVQLPRHYDFTTLRLSPAETRQRFASLGWRRVVAFQTRNPMHRAHQEITFRAARDLEANLLVQAIEHHYPHNTMMLSLLPLAMRMAGPREALWHAIIRKNHGCTHFIVGRDHAGPGSDSAGTPFYGPYDAQELMKEHEADLGIEMVPFKMLVYLEDQDNYVPINEVPDGQESKSLSGTELRERLATGRDVPSWFSFPDVVTELRRTHPPRDKQGFTVFFTGLPSSGKSTLANVLMVKLLEMGGRPVTLLDGDIVRTNLSSELGFSKEHRDINIRRIGFVASEITKNGGIAICAPIAPYDSVRQEVRNMIKSGGGFILVHVSTPLEICEQRDRKGLYAKARAGIVKEFTGISDPYEVPEDADLAIDTTSNSPEECTQQVLLHLEKLGYVGPENA